MEHWGTAVGRRRFGKVVVAAAAALIVPACQGDDEETPAAAANERGEPGAVTPKATVKPSPTPKVRFEVSPGANAKDVRPDTAVTIRVSRGTLTNASLTAADGTRVAGEFDDGRTTWTGSPRLLAGSEYRIEATGKDAGGRTSSVEQTFRTLGSAKILGTEIQPLAGHTYGVGQPIVVVFTEPAKDEAARVELERRLVVETAKPVEGAWRWFSDKEVHYRPKRYWPANTQVTLKINTLGAMNGGGAWGIRDKVRTFKIGRSVVTRVDLKTKRMNVYVDGKLARTIPVTGGKKDWETRHGTKVILEKRRNINFRNQAIGAPEEYNLTAPYGLRVTWSGEFLHSAAWSVASQGKRNVSHGCIGMNLPNSKWLWTISQVGDPAETINTGGELMPSTGNGYGDWNLSWTDWIAGSALRFEQRGR